ncbi:MAG TPA: hypothetical protein VF618_23635 [Thermoanaerobaculia bacterium]
MVDDPIVEEVHETRERLLEQHGGIAGFLEHIHQLQETMKDRIVRLPPRKPDESVRKIS